MIPLPPGRGEHPTNVFVFGSRLNLKSVGPSCRSKAGSTLSPVGSAGSRSLLEFSSIPVPSSNNVIEKVLLTRATGNPNKSNPPHASRPSSGTLIHRILKLFTPEKPMAWSGKAVGLIARALGFKSAHAGAILGGPVLSSGTVGEKSVSPAPNVMFPFEFRKNPFHTHPAVPTGPPNTNSNPPESDPVNGGVP